MQLPEYNKLTDSQRQRINEYLFVTLYLDEEMIAGIDHQIPMTNELFRRTSQILEKFNMNFTLKEFISDFCEYGN